MKFVFSIFALLVLVAGCATVRPPIGLDKPWHEGVKATVYFPLPEGASWVYDVTQFQDGEPLRTTTVISKVDNRIGDLVMMTTGVSPISYEIKPDGIVYSQTEIYDLKEPIRAGARWSVRTPEFTADNRILAVDGQVEVEAGAFVNCLVVESTYGEPGGRVLVRTFAPEVGIVRMESFESGPQGLRPTSKADLRIYQLASEAISMEQSNVEP